MASTSSVFLQLLILAYASASIIELFAYWPTIKDLLAKKASANLTSYFLWLFTTSITLLYSLFILPDLIFQIVSLLEFLAVLIIVLLTFRLYIKK